MRHAVQTGTGIALQAALASTEIPVPMRLTYAGTADATAGVLCPVLACVSCTVGH